MRFVRHFLRSHFLSLMFMFVCSFAFTFEFNAFPLLFTSHFVSSNIVINSRTTYSITMIRSLRFPVGIQNIKCLVYKIVCCITLLSLLFSHYSKHFKSNHIIYCIEFRVLFKWHDHCLVSEFLMHSKSGQKCRKLGNAVTYLSYTYNSHYSEKQFDFEVCTIIMVYFVDGGLLI